ncbi:hypothetical protein GLOTRDRAFT_134365 [Gloeophyllum trabeum ATCC 11539]|uniref:Uncharacterized protein n=1 Tax=Gloeophyllum trabeum (strain ATCC 11539 / FP-39264 / Madison 617) TaxID=670483 RepID=S7RC99_GLOTA|nr:uncharacterized protein GLOTRDRAFT_134365 [Gloeophyllum trabeum ATCC 11539]EPQ49994.1 hypothetical protein GLOTRDRAFT_134365 [Gloeophyllum trabeum ATCC 11539]
MTVLLAAGFLIEQEQAHEWVRRHGFEPESEQAYPLIELHDVANSMGLKNEVCVFGLPHEFKDYGKPTYLVSVQWRKVTAPERKPEYGDRNVYRMFNRTSDRVISLREALENEGLRDLPYMHVLDPDGYHSTEIREIPKPSEAVASTGASDRNTQTNA